VNNCEQFAADLLDGVTRRAVKHLRVHVQRRIDVGMAHPLRDHLAGHPFVVRQAVGTRRILHWNVTDHPTAEWTIQQFRMVASGDQPHRFVVHDHDSIYSEGVERTIAAMDLAVLKTPVRAPQANAFCERLIGTIGSVWTG